MTQYLLSVHSVAAEACETTPPEPMQQPMQQVYALQDEMKSAGALGVRRALDRTRHGHRRAHVRH